MKEYPKFTDLPTGILPEVPDIVRAVLEEK